MPFYKWASIVEQRISCSIGIAGAGLLYSGAAISLVSATAASGVHTKTSTAAEVAAYSARLQLLQVALHQSAKAVLFSSSTAIDGLEQSNTGGQLYAQQSRMMPFLLYPAACKHYEPARC